MKFHHRNCYNELVLAGGEWRGKHDEVDISSRWTQMDSLYMRHCQRFMLVTLALNSTLMSQSLAGRLALATSTANAVYQTSHQIRTVGRPNFTYNYGAETS